MAIYQKYYTDNAGKQYSVSLDYERDGRPRGYYLTIFPVELELLQPGIYSTRYTIDAEFLRERVHALQKQVSRASKKAAAEAVEAMEAPIQIYFYPRGIAHIGNMAECIEYAEQRKEGTAGNDEC